MQVPFVFTRIPKRKLNLDNVISWLGPILFGVFFAMFIVYIAISSSTSVKVETVQQSKK